MGTDNKATLENINNSIYTLCGMTYGKQGAKDFAQLLDNIYHFTAENYLVAEENAIGNNQEIVQVLYTIRDMKERILEAIHDDIQKTELPHSQKT